MTMSTENIHAFGEQIDPGYSLSPCYYIHPLNEEITELSNITLDTYRIPTNKLSDIHAILHIRHPDKNYQLKCPAKIVANNGIIHIYSDPNHPTIFAVKPHETNLAGNYLINTNHITPVSCDHLSITPAIRTMNTKIHEQFSFMRTDTHTIYGQTNIARIISPFHRKDTYIRFYVGNQQYNQDIAVDIDIHHDNNIVHQESFIIPRNQLHLIESSIMNAGHHILTHIQKHPTIYCQDNDSQHQYIALLRCANDYFTQPNNSLAQHVKRCTQDLLNHYTYVP